MSEKFTLKLDEIRGQEFFGKSEFIGLIASQSFKIGNVVCESCCDLADRYHRFLENVKNKTEHEIYAKNAIKELVVKLDRILEENCLIVDISLNPNFLYGLYIHQESGSVLAAIRGYDVQKTSVDEWKKIWG